MSLNHTSEFSDLTESQYTALGKLVVEWANIEFLLGVILGRLLVTPDFHARTFTDSMSAAKIQDAISEALEIHQKRYRYKLISKKTIDQLIKINKEIITLRANRNKIAHFCWSRDSNDSIWGTNFSGGMPSAKKENKDHKHFSVAELQIINKQAFELVDELERIIESLPKFEEDKLLIALSLKSSEN
jgi:hypothetical protein